MNVKNISVCCLKIPWKLETFLFLINDRIKCFHNAGLTGEAAFNSWRGDGLIFSLISWAQLCHWGSQFPGTFGQVTEHACLDIWWELSQALGSSESHPHAIPGHGIPTEPTWALTVAVLPVLHLVSKPGRCHQRLLGRGRCRRSLDWCLGAGGATPGSRVCVVTPCRSPAASHAHWPSPATSVAR